MRRFRFTIRWVIAIAVKNTSNLQRPRPRPTNKQVQKQPYRPCDKSEQQARCHKNVRDFVLVRIVGLPYTDQQREAKVVEPARH